MSFFDSYPGLKRQLSALLSPEESPSDSLLALQTVGHLCRNPAHRAALLADNNPEFLSLFYARLHDLVLNNRGDLRADGLAILAEVAESDDNEGSAEIFGRFGEGEEAASLLMKYAQMPFENVSVMSYEVLLRMARNKWGLQKIDNQVCLGLLRHVLLYIKAPNHFLQAGLVEFLLNRNATGCQRKRVMELKHSILSAALDHEASADIFKPHVRDKMAEYVKKGVFYTQSMDMEVSTDV